jgi:hypothetical protein
MLFSRTSKPISIKLGANYPWVKGIQACSNKGPGPLQRGDNYKNVKMGWGHLKIFSRTTGAEKLRFIGKLPDTVQNRVSKNHGPRGSDRKNHF